jgi:hypothetical protein
LVGVPSNLMVSAGNAFVELMWDLVNSAQSYRVEWFSDPVALFPSNGTVSDGPLTVTHRYIYTVHVGAQAIVLSAAPAPADSSAPATVSITSGVSENTLSWSPVSGAVGYRVYWGYQANVSPTTGTRIEVGSPTSYTHTDLAAGTHYYYVVTALQSNNTQGAASAEVGARPGEPRAASAEVSGTEVTLSWSGTVDSVTVSTSQTFDVSSTPFPLDENDRPSPVVVSGLANNTRHAFRVRPVFLQGVGPAVPTVFATPRAGGAPSQVTLTAGRGVNTLSWAPVAGATYDVVWSATDLSGAPIDGTVTGITDPRFRQSDLLPCRRLDSTCPTYKYSVRTSGSVMTAPTVEAVSLDLPPVPPLVVNTDSVMLAGVKPSGTRVEIRNSDGKLIARVPSDRAVNYETDWTATIDLPYEGMFVFQLVAVDESGLASVETSYHVTRDMTAPSTPTNVRVDACQSVPPSTKVVTLSGDKDSGVGVFRKLEPDAPDQQIVGATPEATWSGVIGLDSSATQITVVAKDAAGNASGPVQVTLPTTCP